MTCIASYLRDIQKIVFHLKEKTDAVFFLRILYSAIFAVAVHKIKAFKNLKEMTKKGVSGLILETKKLKKEKYTYLNDRKKDIRKMIHQMKDEDFIQLIAYGCAAYFTGGKMNMEGGIHDLDLILGIGKHRNIFSHSLLLPLAIEFFIRFILEIGDESVEIFEELENGSAFKTVYDKFKNNFVEPGIDGMYLGSALHLFKDYGLGRSRIKPLVGFIGRSMDFHKRFLLSNACTALLFSIPLFNKKGGE